MNADGSEQRRLTQNDANEFTPCWSPDGLKIAFASNREGSGRAEIYIMRTDGSELRKVTNDPGRATEPAWSPDGSKIAFTSNRDGNNEVYVINLNIE